MRWYSSPLMMILVFLSMQCFEATRAGDKKDSEKADRAIFVVPPAGGKEAKLVDWKFTLGVRAFALTNEPPAARAKAPVGPDYLEFREDRSTTYYNGILTLIPLASIRKIDYDRAKKSVAVTVMKAEDQDETLTGTTKYEGANKLTIEGDAILEGLGAATVKFQGGSANGLRSIRFPHPRPVDPVKGTAAVIVALDKEKTAHTVYDLQPLYLSDGAYRVLPYLMFKKTVKIDIDRITALRFVPSADKKQLSQEYEVSLRDGDKHTLTLLSTLGQDKKKGTTLVGLVGRSPVGFKLFPPHTIQELRLRDEKK